MVNWSRVALAVTTVIMLWYVAGEVLFNLGVVLVSR